MAFHLPCVRSSKEQVKEPTPSTRTMNSSEEKSTSKSREATSPVVPPPPSAASQKKKVNPKKAEDKPLMKKKITLDMVAVLIAGFILACLLLYVLIKILNSSGTVLLYLVGIACLILVTVFCTAESLLYRELKLWGIASIISALVLVAGAVTMLIVQTQKDYSKMNDKEEGDTKTIQRVAAITIVVMVCHILAISHYLYVKFSKKLKQEASARYASHPRDAVSGIPPHRMTYMIEAQ